MNILGIDPGWESTGVAITSSTGELLHKEFFKPSDLGLKGSIQHLSDICIDHEFSFGVIERYVPYQNVFSSSAERILHFIGALNLFVETDLNAKFWCPRAIDWKPLICKYLVKAKGFDNPYQSFDKDYSILAAETLSGQKFETDHEADAVCLSYLPMAAEYMDKEKQTQKSSKKTTS